MCCAVPWHYNITEKLVFCHSRWRNWRAEFCYGCASAVGNWHYNIWYIGTYYMYECVVRERIFVSAMRPLTHFNGFRSQMHTRCDCNAHHSDLSAVDSGPRATITSFYTRRHSLHCRVCVSLPVHTSFEAITFDYTFAYKNRCTYNFYLQPSFACKYFIRVWHLTWLS